MSESKVASRAEKKTDRKIAAAVEGSAASQVREVLARVGDKWSVLVVFHLRERALRFGELRRGIEGISQRMLTLTLRNLERDGLATRTLHATIPPKVDYELTPLGRTLTEPVALLAQWAERNRRAIEKARGRYDARPPAPARGP